jgi:hypothetical protein
MSLHMTMSWVLIHIGRQFRRQAENIFMYPFMIQQLFWRRSIGGNFSETPS